MTIEEMKARIAEIDKLLDNDITDAEFDKLEKEAQLLTSEIGRIESAMRLRSAKALVRVSEWEASFLSSFSCGTRKITNKQAEIFKRFNNGKPFIYNGQRFNCQSPDYRAGFSRLVVTDISNLQAPRLRASGKKTKKT